VRISVPLFSGYPEFVGQYISIGLLTRLYGSTFSPGYQNLGCCFDQGGRIVCRPPPKSFLQRGPKRLRVVRKCRNFRQGSSRRPRPSTIFNPPMIADRPNVPKWLGVLSACTRARVGCKQDQTEDPTDWPQTRGCARGARNQTKPTKPIQLMVREDTTLLPNVPHSWFDPQNRTAKGFQPRPFGFIAPSLSQHRRILSRSPNGSLLSRLRHTCSIRYSPMSSCRMDRDG